MVGQIISPSYDLYISNRLNVGHQSVSQMDGLSARPSVHWYISQLDYSSIRLPLCPSTHLNHLASQLVSRLAGQSVSQSAGQPVSRSASQLVSWSVGLSVSQLVLQSLNQRVGPLINILTALTPLIPVLPTAR